MKELTKKNQTKQTKVYGYESSNNYEFGNYFYGQIGASYILFGYCSYLPWYQCDSPGDVEIIRVY